MDPTSHAESLRLAKAVQPFRDFLVERCTF